MVTAHDYLKGAMHVLLDLKKRIEEAKVSDIQPTLKALANINVALDLVEKKIKTMKDVEKVYDVTKLASLYVLAQIKILRKKTISNKEKCIKVAQIAFKELRLAMNYMKKVVAKAVA